MLIKTQLGSGQYSEEKAWLVSQIYSLPRLQDTINSKIDIPERQQHDGDKASRGYDASVGSVFRRLL
ncbi:MAG: hypothetical protein CME18_09060 [Gemmatimonadetes bacterium]|nr:hypothetical protein [Gemmatimonadota bacterium]